jgi:hypothetical protein
LRDACGSADPGIGTAPRAALAVPGAVVRGKAWVSTLCPMTEPKTIADHHDARIVLELYALRREAVMRASRDVMRHFTPGVYEELAAILKPDHPHNAAWRQVSSYFEMAWGFARHGAVHADLLAEGTGEGMFLFAKVHPWLAELRRDTAPTTFANAEWMLANSASARTRFQLFRTRLEKAKPKG